LNAQFGFNGDSVDEHSAQWARPIQTSRPYFQQVLRSCQLQPAPGEKPAGFENVIWANCAVVKPLELEPQ